MSKKKPKKTKSPQVDENELLKVIDIITKKLAYKFKFGYHDIEDMKQQISIFAIEGLKNYDHKRPLENFLWTHVRNRLFNYKRDNYQRPDKPCYSCPLFDKGSALCTKYSNKNDCDLYAKWLSRNQNKKNLMHLTTVDEIKDYGNIFLDSSEQFDHSETLQTIENNLNGEYRSTYLKLKNGTKVSKSDKDKLLAKIREILCLKNEDN
jgi:DNA-directed RNA polymerase specialized sigma24 family protein